MTTATISLPSGATIISREMRHAIRILHDSVANIERLERDHTATLGSLTHQEMKGAKVSMRTKRVVADQIDYLQNSKASLSGSIAVLEDMVRNARTLSPISASVLLERQGDDPPAPADKNEELDHLLNQLTQDTAGEPAAQPATQPLFPSFIEAGMSMIMVCQRNGLTGIGRLLENGEFLILPGSQYQGQPSKGARRAILNDRAQIELSDALSADVDGTRTFLRAYVFRGAGQAASAILGTPISPKDWWEATVDLACQKAGIDRLGLISVLQGMNDLSGVDAPLSDKDPQTAVLGGEDRKEYLRIRAEILRHALETLAPGGQNNGPARFFNDQKRIIHSRSDESYFQIRRNHLEWATFERTAAEHGTVVFVFGNEGYVSVPAADILDLIADEWNARQDRGGDEHRHVYGTRLGDGTVRFDLGKGKRATAGSYAITRS